MTLKNLNNHWKHTDSPPPKKQHLLARWWLLCFGTVTECWRLTSCKRVKPLMGTRIHQKSGAIKKKNGGEKCFEPDSTGGGGRSSQNVAFKCCPMHLTHPTWHRLTSTRFQNWNSTCTVASFRVMIKSSMLLRSTLRLKRWPFSIKW